MDALAIIGFILLLTSGAEVDSVVSVMAMVIQFLLGLALITLKFIKILREEIENEEII